MKAILALTFVLFFGTIAMAQDTATTVKVEAIEMGVVLSDNTLNGADEVSLEGTKEVVRIYKRKNSRVKKELIFTTKYNKAKLA